MAKQTVLITGSSSGIGRATAELLAQKGYRVLATMRNPDKGRELTETASSEGWDLTVIPLDVRDDASVQAALRQAGDIVIILTYGEVEEHAARAVADAILEAIEKGDNLRYPVGADAQMVLMARKQMDDETFLSTMRQRLGLTW